MNESNKTETEVILEQTKGIIELQADFSCDYNCEACEKFFKCKSPKKLEIFERKRMGRVLQVMKEIKHKVAICAGKGGVGKSMFTVNLGAGLAMRGKQVNIIDQDLDGPCIPKMFGEIGKKMEMGDKGILPVTSLLGIRLISLGFVIKEEEIVTWFQEKRRNATEEFIAHVDHGTNVDYLLIDLPPGTSSDAVNIMEYIPDLDGMILVTNPTSISQIVARRATVMAIEGGVNVLGIIENLSGYVCPHCGEVADVFKTGGGKKLAELCGVPFLGSIPIDPLCSKSSDEGVPYVYKYPASPATKATFEIIDRIQAVVEKEKGNKGT